MNTQYKLRKCVFRLLPLRTYSSFICTGKLDRFETAMAKQITAMAKQLIWLF